MHDFLSGDVTRRWQGEAAGVRRIADEVMSELARRTRASADTVDPPRLMALMAAALDGDEALDAVREEFRVARISAEVLSDTYIPLAARQLGDDWVKDRLGFAEVTIATARLQRLARELASSWSADQNGVGRPWTVLLAVPEFEDHTLGAIVAAGQLRRAGCSVCLRLKATLSDLTALVRTRSFDAVLISVANTERTAHLRRIVRTIRAARQKPVPVLLGGAIAGRAPRLGELTAADLVVSDVSEALAYLTATSAAARDA